ncbi:hypothetical protein FGG08_002942 [Glutinoglossum americanum]|uniref:Zinc finger Mcm10/DnaG-type domain-containing protein n=1 Tax=Glutinoglossum americanum TaxID=1670608 RepID=A0A9P8L431_9PEZI|nr:hypothetical protein FGG08_002942 [Glutinoglossum americanum]
MSNDSVADTRWPPKSPHDVLLSTPSGRNRLRQLEGRLSPSPSPLKRTKSTPSFRARARQLLQVGDGIQFEDDEEEDEETLQLQLQAIEARLKLKRLRQAKAKGTTPSSDIENDGRGSSRLSSRAGSVAARASSALEARRGASETAKGLQRTRSQSKVQVPLSPPRQARKVEEPRSPGRVLLGIDKGLRGRDVSLRRAPNLRRGNDENHQSRNSPVVGGLGPARTSSLLTKIEERPKSFNERMAETRVEDRRQKEREQKILRSRSKGFGIDEKELEQYKNAAAAKQESMPPLTTAEQREFGREEVLRAAGAAKAGVLRGGKTVSSLQAGMRIASNDTTTSTSATSTLHSKASSHARSSSSTYPLQPPPALSDDEPASSSTNSQQDHTQFDPFSSFHLSKRILPHGFLTRQLTGKHIYLIPDLLKAVKSPSYDPPDIEGDWVVFGIIGSKSTPLDHKGDGRKTALSTGDGSSKQRGKFMAVTLTDLKWELTLYLFDSAFERFWKLAPGSVIALLNPNIMPPRPGRTDTGCFSLMLNSSDDTLLEIGVARDLTWCKAMQKDGKQCFRWVDKRHTEFCDFHVDARLKKVKAGRMEVNTITAPFAPGGSTKSRFFGGAAGRGRGAPATTGPNPKENGLRSEGAMHNRVTGTYFVTPSVTNRSTAALIDDNDVDPDAFHRGTSRQERLRRRIVERDREREIARKLGESGGGMGSEYLRARTADGKTPGVSTANGDPKTAIERGVQSLTGGRAVEIRLSPIKRKRGASQASGSGPTASSGVGWSFKNVGSMLRKEAVAAVAVPPSGGTQGDKIKEPVRKKTRFVTEKGIREAGRESFGGAAAVTEDEVMGDAGGEEGGDGNDDDDDLDIV